MAPDVEVARDGEVLAIVRGPDGGACMRRHDAANDAWAALWNGVLHLRLLVNAAGC